MIPPYPEGDIAREWLRVVFRGMGFDTGLLFCGICPAGGWHPGLFPAPAWPASAELDTSLLTGPGWELPEWTVLVPEWPGQGEFERAVDVTLEAMVAGGAVVAWVGY